MSLILMGTLALHYPIMVEDYREGSGGGIALVVAGTRDGRRGGGTAAVSFRSLSDLGGKDLRLEAKGCLEIH